MQFNFRYLKYNYRYLQQMDLVQLISGIYNKFT